MLQLFIRFPKFGEFTEFLLHSRENSIHSLGLWSKSVRTYSHQAKAGVKARKIKEQECIPVGCVPPAAVAVSGGGVCLGGVCRGDVCLGGGCLPGGYTPPCPMDKQTPVKTTFPQVLLQTVITTTITENFRFEWTLSVHSYRPPTKLREGNVFTGVCHYVGDILCPMSGTSGDVWGGGWEHRTWDKHPNPPTWDTNPCYWHLVVITGNLFKLVHLRIYPLTPPPPQLVPTPSGGHRNTYGWQAGGTHHTGMYSCCCRGAVVRAVF